MKKLLPLASIFSQVFGVLFLIVGVSVPARAATFTVNSTADAGDAKPGDGICETLTGNGVCTLRAAIQEAGASVGSNTINVPGGTYVLAQAIYCPIIGTSSPSLCIGGNSHMTINGAGPATTFIDGNAQGQVMVISGAGTNVSISAVTVRNGQSEGFTSGGGIYNAATLTLTNSVITGNTAIAGGGIYNDQGSLTVSNTTINNNASAHGGGGIFNSVGTATLTDSTINGNTDGSNGGGLLNSGGTVTITGGTISGNTTSGGGGAIFNMGGAGPGVIDNAIVTLVNTTVSGNTSGGSGGGIDNGFNSNFTSAVNLNNVTVTNNTSGTKVGASGGGIFNNGGTVNLKNTILAGNKDFEGFNDCATSPPQPPLNSLGYNLIQNTTGCTIGGDPTGNITGKDAKLSVLTNNGGPTQTVALLPGSPAIDAANPAKPGSGGNACAATDQRGFFRPFGKACDIGAFESIGTLSVSGVAPNSGGNTGSVVTIVSGNDFLNGAAVRLTLSGQPDIMGNPVAVDPGSSAMATTFDLTGQTAGSRNVVVMNPDGTSATLPGGFAVQATQAPQLWVDIVGPVRPGQLATYNVLVGNRGNVDAVGVNLGLTVPQGFPFTPVFPIVPPPPQTGQVPTDWSRVPTFVLPDSGGFVTYPLFLPVVPAGYTSELRFELMIPPSQNSFLMIAGVNPPYFSPDLDPQVVSTVIAGAKTYAQQNLGVTIPAALDPILEQYLTNQLQTAVQNGRNIFVASLGEQTQPYSLGQLLIDLAQFGASKTTAGASTTAAFVSEAFSIHEASRLRGPVDRLRPLDTGCVSCCTNYFCPVAPPGCAITESVPPCPPKPAPTPPGPINPADCLSMQGFHLDKDQISGQPGCVPNACTCINSLNPDACGSSICFPDRPPKSQDPNDKFGPQGATAAQYLPGDTPLRYAISVTNEATATAPAQAVVITDQLDTVNMDLSTFAFGPISFGTTTLSPPPGSIHYIGGVDLRPLGQNVLLRVEAGLSQTSGLATWQFSSLDPLTLQPAQDPLAGFLPPDTNPPVGEGRVLFNVKLKPGVSTGTAVRNQAQVTFDVNPPISTPVWLNTIDETKPTSHVLPLPATENSVSFPIQWAGTDIGSGISDFSIFVSQNGGPFSVFLNKTSATSATFTGQAGNTYAFYSVAKDLVGNLEDPHPAPDTMTQIVLGTPRISGSVAAQGKGPSGALYVDLKITNSGTGNARNVMITQLSLRTLSGTGSVSYNAVLSLPVPITVGSVDAGASNTIRLFFDVPSTVTKFSITENGTLQDVNGGNYNFSTGEAVTPLQ